MLLLNTHPERHRPLDATDAEMLGVAGAEAVERVLAWREAAAPTPLVALTGMAGELGLCAIHVKDEASRLGLGSFKALGGGYAVIRLVLEEAERRLGRDVALDELQSPQVRDIAAAMTFGCATDGNHGRSVAQGATLVGARAMIFVHEHVSQSRIAAMEKLGATVTRVAGTYDDSVAEAARVCEANGWVTVSDTAWPGYERIPGLVMQGYTAIIRETLRQIPDLPTHVFIQAGVGGIAAAIAGHLSITLGVKRPTFVVVEPQRAACVYASAVAGHLTKAPVGEPTVMAMLDCYEPSLSAWRVLSRAADAFMTVDEPEAVAIMNRLARPAPGDPAVVSGESGGVGLAGVVQAAEDADMCAKLGLGPQSRILVVNTEGATDPGRYQELVGVAPEAVAAAATR